MSLCIDGNNVLTSQVSTSSAIQLSEKSPNENAPILTTATTPISSPIELNDTQHQQFFNKKTVTKLLVSNQTSVVGNVTPVLQKISNPPVITVLNSAGGPLTVLKTICVTSGVSSAPHFSLVNNQSLTVTNAVGKTPTITLLNTPVTVVKMTPPQSQNVENKPLDNTNCSVSTQNVSTIIENRAHNVFVKNTCSDSSVSDVQQGHKFLTANSFSQTNVLTSIPTTSGKAVNNQRSKLKILSNVVVPSMTSASNIQPSTNQIMTKPNSQPQQQQRLVPRQKVLGPNGNQPKYINKLANNSQQQKSVCNLKQNTEKAQQQAKLLYPTHKSQIKTLPPMNNYMTKPSMKPLNSQQPKNIPAQVQRTGSGLRTIPPQRPPKLPNKLNYIGKHAVQAQKIKHGQNRFNKPLKQPAPAFYNSCVPSAHSNKQLAFNQALTAEILETLGNKTGPTTSYQSSKGYEIMPNRYSTPYEEQTLESMKYEDKSKSGLDALSLICQAVLLDHNYNATLPPDSPTRTVPLTSNPLQPNGMTGTMLIYSPGGSSKNKYPPDRSKILEPLPSGSDLKRGSFLERTLSCSNTISTSSSLTNISSSLPSNSTSLVNLQDDDAASDISDCSDRKHDTEGEETDTAPEAEAVNNDELYDHYGDYVTRCICGFLHDDGYMVECDQCKVWQHVQCVVKNKQVPDEYLCEKCNPSKPVDPQKARMIQQQWLKERQLPEMKNFKKDIKMKENPKLKEIPSDTDSSDAENPKNNNNTVNTKGRTPTTQRKKTEKPLTKQKKELKESNLQRKSFKKRERKLIRRKSKLQTKKEEDENRESLSMTQLPQLRQWIENYEEAVTNHYSPELRARISNIRVNGSQNIDTSVPYDPSVNKCRVHTLPLTDLKYLVATEDVSPDSSIIELRGKYMLSIQHRNPGGNLNTRQHAQRPGPFLFFYRLNKDNTEVCVDTRTYGNVARFVRRSCKPNAELRHCIEKGVLHLFIVAIFRIEKCAEITIKHESHDLAAIGTTQISCYCGNPAECKVNKTTVKRNGEAVAEVCRKKRGRRTASISTPSEPETPPVAPKEEAPVCEPSPPAVQAPAPRSPSPVKIKVEKMEEEVQNDVKTEEDIEVKEEILDVKETEVVPVKEERPVTPVEEKDSPVPDETSESDEKDVKKEEKENECKKSPVSVSTRRSSQNKGEKEKDDEKPATKQEKSKNKKLSREERKLEAILRAIEQMEKANQRKQEHKQTKHVQRRESEPSPYSKEEEKTADLKQKRKRKGRARTTSTHSTTRRDRLNSGDSYFTSGDENMLSPNDGIHPKKADETTDDSTSGKHEGFLLTFSNKDETGKRDKSPIRENDSNSNSAHSSPETPLSLACSLVQAAVEPLESGFKFPKTKKGMMNEWLNKTPEAVQTATSSPLSLHIQNAEAEMNANFNAPSKIVASESAPKGSAKKRWLRQAISEDKCDSPQESPPISDMVAPPKKRRLPRESISNDNTPPSTPTSLVPPENRMDCEAAGGPSQEPRSFHLLYEDCVDSQKETLESDHVLKERAAEMKQEFGKTLTTPEINQRPDTLSFGCLMDPRLRNHHFANSEHLVGTVEKTLSILGFEERKPEVPPIRRKLSITEYRQRKKLNNNEVCDKSEETGNAEDCVNEENNSSESFQMSSARPRANSPSSSSSSSSDDETSVITELPAKVPAFNSEPTELERQREMQSLRLKKAFGLSIDVEPKKPAITGDSIFKSELTAPPLIKSFTILDSPGYPTPSGSEISDVNKSTLNSPRLHAILTQTDRPGLSPNMTEQERDSPVVDDKTIDGRTTPITDERQPEDVVMTEIPEKEIVDDKETSSAEEVMDFEEAPEEDEEDDDEAEIGEKGVKPHLFYTPDEEEEEEEVEEKEFPETESVSYVPPFNNPIYPSISYTSVIDEEGRYEGRNPSPPPSHL
ncbi:uncharacterized protein LOC123314454 isoform X2 [Coccinella septempunctata]|uniref:uncharacterized protein LOC123314454 isoform X2 n=1 Tax=Coccinella septempunctata TaxID=41139 RepID=UPI001D060C31|nr:uncharacterized protein LOC123314454 isoform X2 [Coccinella septempunctata]